MIAARHSTPIGSSAHPRPLANALPERDIRPAELTMLVLKWILGWLSGGVLDRLLAHFEKKQDTALERDKLVATVSVEEIKAEIETRKLQAQLIQVEQGWWVTALMRPFLFYPLAAHYVAVVGDSMFHFSWDVDRLPAPMDEWQGTILLSLFLSRPLEKFGRSFIDYLRNK